MADSRAAEILKSAILLERRGKAFYAKVAADTKSPAAREIFLAMAKEEDLHVEQLSQQFAHYQKNQKFLKVDPPKGSGEIADSVLTQNIKTEINAASFEAAAISAAMAMEQRAIDTYSKRAAETSDPDEKKLYQWLSGWEHGHLDYLVSLEKELTESVWYDNKFWPY